MSEEYCVGDSVLSSSKYTLNKAGLVYRVTDKAVHVNFGTKDEPSYQKFHFKPEHHMQSPITQIQKI